MRGRGGRRQRKAGEQHRDQQQARAASRRPSLFDASPYSICAGVERAGAQLLRPAAATGVVRLRRASTALEHQRSEFRFVFLEIQRDRDVVDLARSGRRHRKPAAGSSVSNSTTRAIQ